MESRKQKVDDMDKDMEVRLEKIECMGAAAGETPLSWSHDRYTAWY